ncbi:MAG: hypothetical protein ACP5J4_05885 [Anaerolineae bacterium]
MKATVPQEFVELSFQVARYHVHQRDMNDCGPYCVAMVTNTLYGAPFVNAEALSEELNSRGFPERIPDWATLPWGVVASLRRLGLRARWRPGTSLRRLFNNLRQDRMTIVLIGEPLHFEGRTWRGWSHYKILDAWDPDRELGFVDPATSGATGMTWQALDEFHRQWAWMGKQTIEVGRA